MGEDLTIYRYVPPERLADLESETMRFTQPGALNDPVEMRPHFHSIVPPDVLNDKLRTEYPESVKEAYERLPDSLKARMNVEQFLAYMLTPERRLAERLASELGVRADYITDKLQSVLDHQVAIVSFTEDPNNPLMWAHYAACHTGLVYGFDRSNEFFCGSDGSSQLHRVIYSKERPRVTLWDVSNHEIYLTKSVHWSYEREWRIFSSPERLSDTGDVDPREYPVLVGEFPTRALKYVALGCRATPETRERLVRALAGDRKYEGVRAFQAQVGRRHFRLSLRRVAIANAAD